MQRILFAALLMIASVSASEESSTVAIVNATKRSLEATEFCWRDSYGRGAGRIPTACRDDEVRIGLLCYDKCSKFGPNFARFGFDCHQTCPKGEDWSDQGLFCRKNEYGRGVGRSPCTGCTGCSGCGWGGCSGCSGCSDCGTDKCHANEDVDGALCYPKCKEGYEPFGCCICRPKNLDCGALGFAGQFDISCTKTIHIGKAWTGICNDDEQEQLGLCYENCDDGYTGVGPVCWGMSPTVDGQKWVDCGMGSAADDTTCGFVIADQVLGPIFAVIDIVSLGSANGATTAAREGIEASSKLAKAAKKAVEFAEKAKDVYDEIKDPLKQIIQAAKGEGDAPEGGQNTGTVVDSVRGILDAAGDIDPTGLASAAAAYTYPLCKDVGGATF